MTYFLFDFDCTWIECDQGIFLTLSMGSRDIIVTLMGEKRP